MAYAQKALDLDPSSADAHSVMALVFTIFEWDWERVQSGLVKAMELRPNDANILGGYASILSRSGRHREAIDLAKLNDPAWLAAGGQLS